VQGIGPRIAESVDRFLSEPNSRELVERLKKHGLSFTSGSLIETAQLPFFSGKSFVLTGTLSAFTREKARQIIERYGGKASGSVSKKTDYVLAGENAGSKLDKATKLDIRILSEEEFLSHIPEETIPEETDELHD